VAGEGLFGGLFGFVTEAAQQFAAAVREYRKAERSSDDAYVAGGTHWDGYSHKALFKMVWEKADPTHVERLADTWQRQGASISERSDELQRSLAKLLQHWSGGAADEASRTVLRNAAWLSDLGETATRMAAPVEHAAGALRSAQQQMPAPPEGFSWGSLAGGAAAGAAFGGPAGAAIGAVLGGVGSFFASASKKRKLKRRAVQTMQRFETAALDVDGSTPAFGGPAAGGGGAGAGGPGATPGSGIGTPPVVRVPPGGSTGDAAHGGSTGTSGAGGPGSGSGSGDSTVPSFASGSDARWNALTSGPGGAGFDAAKLGLGAGKPGAGLPGANGLWGGLPGVFPPGLGPTGRGAGGGRGGVGGGVGGGLLRGRPGAGGAGYGPGAIGRRGEGDEDSEHERRYPFEEDPFALDAKAAPPVIGL
jgi:hypothetical protein